MNSTDFIPGHCSISAFSDIVGSFFDIGDSIFRHEKKNSRKIVKIISSGKMMGSDRSNFPYWNGIDGFKIASAELNGKHNKYHWNTEIVHLTNNSLWRYK